jgi:hypothetical protein
MEDHRFMPRRARIHKRTERWQLFVIGLASLYEGVVAVLSLGYLKVKQYPRSRINLAKGAQHLILHPAQEALRKGCT